MRSLLLLFIGACASQPTAGSGPAPLFFYEVTHPDRAGHAYVLGTAHLRRAEDATLDDAVWKVIDAGVPIWMESDPNRPAHLEAEGQDPRFLPEGGDLQQLIAAATWSELAAYLNERGLSPDYLHRLTPWAAGFAIRELLGELDGVSGWAGVEWTIARSIGARPIGELEGSEVQLKMLASLSMESQECLLAGVTRASAAVDDYQRGDEDAMAKRARIDAAPCNGQYADVFLRQRNHRFADRFAELFDSSPLMAVGALHVVGEQGILHLLEERGFRVRRVPPSGVTRAPLQAPAFPIDMPEASAVFPSRPSSTEGPHPETKVVIARHVAALTASRYELIAFRYGAIEDEPQAFLKRFIEGLAQYNKASIAKAEPTELAGHPGLVANLVNGEGGTAEIRLILSGTTVLQAGAYLEGRARPDDRRRATARLFFDSLVVR